MLLGMIAAFGSMLARTKMGPETGGEEGRKKRSGWIGEMFLMLAGAVYLALNVAPTVEMQLLSFIMGPWHAVALALASLVMMHAFVYVLEFKGSEPKRGEAWWSLLLRFTIPGYGVAMGVAAYLLWTFGRLEGLDLQMFLIHCITLAFPASVGAAAARLIL
jgi:putative integral membrane protein (TIGR02587 family)